jgi:nucleoid-associated protein YgaU
MKNPLVLFVGAAVVAVAAVAAVTVDRWQEWPSPSQTTAVTPDTIADETLAPMGAPGEVVRQPEAKDPATDADTAEQAPPAARPVEEAHLDEAVPAEPAEALVEAPAVELEAEAAEPVPGPVEPERLAAVDPHEPQPAPPSRADSETAAPEPEPDAAASIEPSFDIVRLEDDGSLVIAGRAAPSSEVALLFNGEAIATSTANLLGEWLIMPDEPLPPGNHELAVVATGPSGDETKSDQVIALAVPDRVGERPLVVLSQPSQPSQVLDRPRPPAVAQHDEEIAEVPVPRREEEPVIAEPMAEPDAPASEVGEPQVTLAPIPEPEAPALPQVEPEAPEPEPHQQAAIAPEAEIEPAPMVAPSEPELERPAPPIDIPLALETVDYNDDGEIIFSGRAEAGHTVRIYVDNRFIGETMADGDGRWVFAGREQIAPGYHALRADKIDATGTVVARIELPFVRAESRLVASLLEARREAALEQQAPEPEAPVVAEEVAPEPEPEAPVVAEEIAPEPEPEAPVVAEAVAPEPEPEAPVVAEAIAPEPEPETPVVAEAIAPEPEPETPVVAEVAPEPEPEAPVVAEAIAPEPEPETPVVAEAIAPEPEPETPVVAEAIAPEPEPETPVVAEVAPEPEPEAPVVAEVAPEPEPEAPDLASAESEVVVPAPGRVIIQPGNNLWQISRVIYGRGVEYTVIYQANRDQIRNPNLIYPGQILTTPGVTPPEEIDPGWRQPLTPEELARQNAAE